MLKDLGFALTWNPVTFKLWCCSFLSSNCSFSQVVRVSIRSLILLQGHYQDAWLNPEFKKKSRIPFLVYLIQC
jgi:hypothetical protein